MKRGREDFADLTLDEAAERIGHVMLTHGSTICRLETLDEVPTDRRRRALAFVAAIAYGLDPAQFGVGPSDAPPTVAEVAASTKW